METANNYTSDTPVCLTEYQKIFGSDNSTVMNMIYRYETCSKEFVTQVNSNDRFECICITSPITQCQADMLNSKCTLIYLTTSSIQAIIIVIGILLNLIVCFKIFQRKETRRKLTNVLFVNQAFADLFNCLMYALPATIYMFISSTYKTDQSVNNFLGPLSDVMAIASISSSLMIFTIIAFERWLSIAKPIFHHAKLRKKHIWTAIVICWFLSISSSLLRLVFDGALYIIYIKLMQTIMVLLISIATVAFFFTWLKAFRTIRVHQKRGADQHSKRKDLQVTKVFSIMYLLFIITFVPLAVVNPNEENPVRRIKFILFTLTAIINPTLTLILRTGFKCRSRSINDKEISSTCTRVIQVQSKEN